MVALLVTSTGEAVGKSALCAGLGAVLQANGKKVGFLKPVSCYPEGSDRDMGLMKQLLALEEPVEALCSVSARVEDLAATVDEEGPHWLKEIEKGYARVSQGKDVVMLEGVGGFEVGSNQARIVGRIVERLGARAILVVPYQVDLEEDRIVAMAKMLADSLLGVVINAVPERRMEALKSGIVASLERSGVKVLGVLPEERALFTVTVRELAEHLGGSIVNSQDRSNELVENLMVGAMSVDSALSYLTLKPNKAVITRGDRPDVQLAALETSTRCLVLTGNMDPAPGILSRALELEVPIVVVGRDTTSTMEALEGVFDKGRFLNEKKLEKLGRILEQHLDLETIHQAI
ncbi:MAG: phosphotransacetylase family protein [Dehalococcoidia bacterium]